MAKQAVFTLTGINEGKTMVVRNRYNFVDGQMKVPEKVGILVAPILCRFHGCDVELIDDGSDAPAQADPANPSLAAAQTKGTTAGTEHNGTVEARNAANAVNAMKGEPQQAKAPADTGKKD